MGGPNCSCSKCLNIGPDVSLGSLGFSVGLGERLLLPVGANQGLLLQTLVTSGLSHNNWGSVKSQSIRFTLPAVSFIVGSFRYLCQPSDVLWLKLLLKVRKD